MALLAQHVRDRYGDVVNVELRPVAWEAAEELRHSDIAELVLSFALGVAGNATYDGIRALVARARERGNIEVDTDLPDEASEDRGVGGHD